MVRSSFYSSPQINFLERSSQAPIKIEEPKEKNGAKHRVIKEPVNIQKNPTLQFNTPIVARVNILVKK